MCARNVECAIAVIVIQCPKTLKYIQTGVEIEPECLAFFVDTQLVLCPHCKREHRWTKAQAILAHPDNWSTSPNVEQCFIKAIENAELAKRAPTARDREFYLGLERKWLKMATGWKIIDDMENRHEI